MLLAKMKGDGRGSGQEGASPGAGQPAAPGSKAQAAAGGAGFWLCHKAQPQEGREICICCASGGSERAGEVRNQFSFPQILLRKHVALGELLAREEGPQAAHRPPGTYLSITSDSLTIWAMSPFWIFCCDSRSWALVHLGKGSRVSSLSRQTRGSQKINS